VAAGEQQQPVLEYQWPDGRRSATAGEVVFGAVLMLIGIFSVVCMVVGVIAVADTILRDRGMAKGVPVAVAAVMAFGSALFSFRFGYEMFRGSQE
jgi:hypothetical protein